MKKITLILGLVLITSFYAGSSKADGCYICAGGSYVKYSGSDNQDKRKAAKACGCTVSGTRGSCDAANLKILCSVENETNQSTNIACDKHDHDKEDGKETKTN